MSLCWVGSPRRRRSDRKLLLFCFPYQGNCGGNGARSGPQFSRFLETLEIKDFQRLMELFPCVKKLNLELETNSDLWSGSRDKKTHLKNLLDVLADWKLERGHVVVNFAEDADIVEAVVSGMLEWTGRKTAVFHRSHSRMNFGMVVLIKDPFMPCNKFDWVEFRGFAKNTWAVPDTDVWETVLEAKIKEFAEKRMCSRHRRSQ
ncbi:uncharacterized protein LOC118435922 [Folsomia candida]|nr:uncharacterized protein LOC118435922 [Folsomia candida]